MIPTPQPRVAPHPIGGLKGLNPWWIALAFLGLLLIVVSRASFWIDEAGTAWFAGMHSMSIWWHGVATSTTTEIQAPLYIAYVWVAAKFIGTGEWPLRFAGALWLIPGLTVFVISFPTRRAQVMAFLVVSTNAFLWFYANEARAYAMQIGAAAMVFGAIQGLVCGTGGVTSERRWAVVFGAGLVLLCLSGLLCMIWASAALGAVVILLPADRLLGWWRQNRAKWALFTIGLGALGCYYVWTVSVGARGSPAGTTDWRTTLFVIYDQCGFSGLGPGRTDLRALGPIALKHFAPSLGAYAIFLGVVMLAGLRLLWRTWRRQILWMAVVILIPWLFLSCVGMAVHFRLLGRHCAPLALVWWFLMVTGADYLWGQAGWMSKALVGVFLGLALCSALRVRFDYTQSKDDYRRAAQWAREALERHETVWWNANAYGAAYYQAPMREGNPQPGEGILLQDPSAASLEAMRAPDLIIASKPDLFDKTGALGAYIAAHGYRKVDVFPAFEVWEPSANHPKT